MIKNYRLLPAFALITLLGACTGADEQELQSWMAEQRGQMKPRKSDIPEPKRFVPQGYSQDAATDPFSSQKLTQALKRESAQVSANAALVAPELNRRKEPLEAFPLDTMRMVGSLLQGKEPVALITVDGLLYQVRRGQYLGQNYGKVTKISESDMTLREIVQDAAGEWIERPAGLQLVEKQQ
jgi:type IV pilus assembly protein PilP